MRTVIILEGLVKKDKQEWVQKEGLQNFLLSIDTARSLLYRPEYTSSGEFLSKSRCDKVYELYIRSVCVRLSSGCLLVCDMGTESTSIIESLAIIFGYQVFYKFFDIPKDYKKDYKKKYRDTKFETLTKAQVKDACENLRSRFKSKSQEFNIIDKYQDVIDYWDKQKSKYYKILDQHLPFALHISDIHSNTELLSKIPYLDFQGFTVFHGDYIDGPEAGGSRKLIDMIIENTDSRFIWLEGNHEVRLRRYLGSLWLGGNKKIVSGILKSDLPPDFISRTAPEFSTDPGVCREYLEELNKKLQEFVILDSGLEKIICSHAGLMNCDQISPKYIGNLIYSQGNNICSTDSKFSKTYKGKGIISIHAHCQYPVVWNYSKYEGVLNLDPPDENHIDYYINGKLWMLDRNESK